MNKLIYTLPLFFLLAGCSGGPSEGDISDSLETQMKVESQNYLDQIKGISGVLGEEAVASALKMAGLPHPDDIHIENMDVKDMQKKDNGDYVTKVTFTAVMGDKKNDLSARLTLTELDDQWKVVGMENL